MSGSNGKGGKAGRRGPGGRKVGRGGRRVLAGRGDGWELWVPEDMPEDERAAYVERQRALLEGGKSAARPRRGRANVAGALDQMTTARPLQLALF